MRKVTEQVAAPSGQAPQDLITATLLTLRWSQPITVLKTPSYGKAC